MKEILKTDNLCKYFKKQKAVDNVSITVRENSIYGLLGPNGAGKSTTLKMITGMLRPTNGKVLFNGHDWTRKDLEQIGALIETPPLYDNLSAAENLEVRAKLLGVPKARIDEVLEIVDLQNTGRKKAGQFSMGMKQRLGIAIALLNNPKLLILDEPTVGIDPELRQQIWTELNKLKDTGKSMLVTTHVMDEAERCDYLMLIRHGIALAEGTPAALKQQYAVDTIEQVFLKAGRMQDANDGNR